MKMRPFLEALRSDAGEAMVLQDNFFIEKIVPGAILRTLSAEEMTEYRRPFAEPGEGRRPTLTFPREIPIEGNPADVAEIVSAYGTWLATSNVFDPAVTSHADVDRLLRTEPQVQLTSPPVLNNHSNDFKSHCTFPLYCLRPAVELDKSS
jgi:hypothetical protein